MSFDDDVAMVWRYRNQNWLRGILKHEFLNLTAIELSHANGGGHFHCLPSKRRLEYIRQPCDNRCRNSPLGRDYGTRLIEIDKDGSA